MNKELVFSNIFDLINNGFFLDKYIELTTIVDELTTIVDDVILSNDLNYFDYIFDGVSEQVDDVSKLEDDSNAIEDIRHLEDIMHLEDIAARIFNAIIIGCQLFDDEERIKRFVDRFSYDLNPLLFRYYLPEFGISKEEAINRLNHGFAVHFTTPKIGEIIQKTGRLVGAGKNAMFSQEEDKIINYATVEQKKNNPTAEATLNYLYRGWGTGVSSYGSTTNGFWMYHTPESLSFLFVNISKRDKNYAMRQVIERISSLDEEDKKIVFDTMSNIYDRLIGDEQNTCCILIDRDAFKYEVDYYYGTGTPVAVERRPFSAGFNALKSNDSLIKCDIDAKHLKFLKIPTIIELERQKNEQLMNNNSSHKL